MQSLKYELQVKHICMRDCSPDVFITTTLPGTCGLIIFWLFKLISFVYWLTWLGLYAVSDGIGGWIFLSNWGVLVIFIYFFSSFAIVSCALFARQWKKGDDQMESHLLLQTNEDQLHWYHRLTWVLQIISLDGAIVITTIYWSFGKLAITAFLFNKHAMNTIFMIIDLFLINIPVRLVHFVYPVIFGLFYSLFTWVLYLTDFVAQVYPYMNWSTHPAVAAAICIGLSTLGCFIVHFIVFLLYKLRVWLVSKCKPR